MARKFKLLFSFTVVVTSLVSCIISILLFIGAKHGRSLYFVPWLTEQVVALTVGTIQGLLNAMGGLLLHVSVVHGFIFFFIVSISCLFIYCVVSHFMLLRAMKKHSKEIINSVMAGNGYQTTNYDRMTEELGREMTEVPPGRARAEPEDNKANAPNRDDILYFSI